MKTSWLQILKDHLTDLKGAGWTDENLTTIDGLIDDILLDTGTTIPGTITTMQGNVTDILADTGEVQVSLADGGFTDLLIDAILADVGDASGATLGSILGILGDPAQSFLAMIGYEGATSLANKLTAARALLLDEITALRMAELDAGNLPADIDTIKGLVDTAETDASFNYLDAGGEQDLYTDAVATRRKISFAMDINAMTQGGVVKVYLKVDGANYRVWIQEDVDSIGSGGTEDVYTIEVVTNQNFKVSYTEDVDEGAVRAIPYSVVTQVME